MSLRKSRNPNLVIVLGTFCKLS